MISEQIPKKSWASFLAGFSRRHSGWSGTLELQETSLSEGDVETRLCACERPLRAIALEPEGGGRVDIELGDGDPFSYSVPAPVALRVDRNEAGEEVDLHVSSASGSTTVLYVRQTAAQHQP